MNKVYNLIQIILVQLGKIEIDKTYNKFIHYYKKIINIKDLLNNFHKNNGKLIHNYN